jgi:hypothetical protein
MASPSSFISCFKRWFTQGPQTRAAKEQELGEQVPLLHKLDACGHHTVL